MAPGVSEARSWEQEDAERERGAFSFFVSCDGGHNSSSSAPPPSEGGMGMPRTSTIFLFGSSKLGPHNKQFA